MSGFVHEYAEVVDGGGALGSLAESQPRGWGQGGAGGGGGGGGGGRGGGGRGNGGGGEGAEAEAAAGRHLKQGGVGGVVASLNASQYTQPYDMPAGAANDQAQLDHHQQQQHSNSDACIITKVEADVGKRQGGQAAKGKRDRVSKKPDVFAQPHIKQERQPLSTLTESQWEVLKGANGGAKEGAKGGAMAAAAAAEARAAASGGGAKASLGEDLLQDAD
jgi:hypothetical protein